MGVSAFFITAFALPPREDGHGTRRLDRETRHGLETEDDPVVFAGASASAEIPFAMARGRREI